MVKKIPLVDGIRWIIKHNKNFIVQSKEKVKISVYNHLQEQGEFYFTSIFWFHNTLITFILRIYLENLYHVL